MINLACHTPSPEKVAEITDICRRELAIAGIPSVHNDPRQRGEVPSEIDGIYEGFTFRRAWYYWVVTGQVPIEVAKEMYTTEIGKRDVRVEGNCSRPPPEKWAISIESHTCRTVTSDKEWEKGLKLFADMPSTLEDWKTNYVPEKDAKESIQVITLYHIDSQEGLNFFMQTIKKYGLNRRKVLDFYFGNRILIGVI